MNFVFFQPREKRVNDVGPTYYDFDVRMSLPHLQWLQRVIARQVKTEEMYLIQYRSRPDAKKETIDRLHKQLDIARSFKQEIDGLMKM